MVIEENECKGEKGHIQTKKSDQGDTLLVDLPGEDLDDQSRKEEAECQCDTTKKNGNHQTLSQD